MYKKLPPVSSYIPMFCLHAEFPWGFLACNSGSLTRRLFLATNAGSGRRNQAPALVSVFMASPIAAKPKAALPILS